MNKKGLEEAIGRAINNLGELEQREPKGELRWDLISENVSGGLALFREVVDIYQQQSARLKGEIDSLPVHVNDELYEYYYRLIDSINRCIGFFRERFHMVFMRNHDEQLHLYLFLSEILIPFEDIHIARKLNNVYFLFVPLGYVAELPLHEQLTSDLITWMEEDLKLALTAAKRQEVYCLGGVPEEDILNQVLLIHEVFHIVLQRSQNLRGRLDNLASALGQTGGVLGQCDPPRLRNWLEEWFCDFAASWFFGPIFGKEFIEEISYVSPFGTASHPPRASRIVFILKALSTKRHPYVTLVRRYQNEIAHEISSESDIGQERSAEEFKQMVNTIGLRRYPTESRTRKNAATVKRNLKNNLPFIYGDIRDFLNSIPVEGVLGTAIIESLWKNIMIRRFRRIMKTWSDVHGLIK